jgi:hypothetical protein
MACSRWPDHLFTVPIQVFTMPIWLFTIPIPVFTMVRDGCSRSTDLGVHDGPKSAGGSYACNRGCDRLIQGREIDAFLGVVGGTGTSGVR